MRFLLAGTVALVCACSGTNAPVDSGTGNGPLSAGLAGTWGGPVQTHFSVGGDFGIAFVLYISVSGETASVSGVCPDGSGPMAVTGSATSASFSGSLTCPSVPVTGCDGVVITYTDANLALIGPTALKFIATGTAVGCGLTASVSSTFSGTLAAAGDNPVPAWDLRFKGVGESFVPTTGGFGGGGAPGAADTFTWTGRGVIAWGLIAGGGFLVDLLYGAAQTAVYQDTIWVDGAHCPATFAAAMTGNNVILALDGDPYQASSTCIILGVGQPDGGPTFQYLTEEAVPASTILDELTGSEFGRSFVLTTLFAVQPGLYTYVAESVGPLSDGGYEQFDTVIQMPLVADLGTAAGALADAGYVITASAWQGEAYYTLVGTRPVGSTLSHATVTVMTDDLTYSGDAEDMLKSGYVPVSLLQDYYTLPDGGLGADTWLIGEK
jgi:hypothetical protein